MRTIVVADVSNLYFCIGRRFTNRKLDYQKYLAATTAGSEFWRALAYGVLVGDKTKRFVDTIKAIGFEPQFKDYKEFSDGKRKADWDIGMCVDIFRSISRFDRVVLGSGDGDFAPLIKYLKEVGIRTVIYASNVSYELKDVAHEWYEINESLLEKSNDPSSISTHINMSANGFGDALGHPSRAGV